jgi:hypothetical protein
MMTMMIKMMMMMMPTRIDAERKIKAVGGVAELIDQKKKLAVVKPKKKE